MPRPLPIPLASTDVVISNRNALVMQSLGRLHSSPHLVRVGLTGRAQMLICRKLLVGPRACAAGLDHEGPCSPTGLDDIDKNVPVEGSPFTVSFWRTYHAELVKVAAAGMTTEGELERLLRVHIASAATLRFGEPAHALGGCPLHAWSPVTEISQGDRNMFLLPDTAAAVADFGNASLSLLGLSMPYEIGLTVCKGCLARLTKIQEGKRGREIRKDSTLRYLPRGKWHLFIESTREPKDITAPDED